MSILRNLAEANGGEHPGPPPAFSKAEECDHPVRRAVVRVFRGVDKTPRYGWQCKNCGDLAGGGWYGPKRCWEENEFQPHEAVAFDPEVRNRWWHRQSEIRSAWSKDRMQNWWNWYDRYLNSKDWKAKRIEVLKRDRFKCASCGNEATQVHHISYDRVGYEPLEDLVSVCDACHDEMHGGDHGGR